MSIINGLFHSSIQLALYHADGKEVCDPADVLLEDWMFLLTLRSRSARMKEYRYLMKRNESKARQVVCTMCFAIRSLVEPNELRQFHFLRKIADKTCQVERAKSDPFTSSATIAERKPAHSVRFRLHLIISAYQQNRDG